MPADPRGQYVMQLHGKLERMRAAIEGDIDDLNRLVLPIMDLGQLRSAHGLDTTPPSHFVNELSDTTACEVLTTLQNGLMAHLTPLGAQWCSLQPANPESTTAHARHWLHEAGQKLLRLLSPSASNFYVELARSYAQDGAFGTSVIIPRVNDSKRLVFESLPMLSYALGLDADGVPATLSRSYTLTAAQAAEFFKSDCPPEVVKQAATAAEKTTSHAFVLLIEPNPDADLSRFDTESLPFRATWVWKAKERAIRDEGFFEQPHAVATWAPSVAGPWGVSPFVEVLPEIRQLQELANQRALLVERAGSPPWFVPPGYDGKFDPRPHAINYPAGARGTADELMPRELPTQGRLDFLQAESEEKIRRIRSAGFYDLFRLLTQHIDTAKTAYEVRELMGEKATLFHPFYARKTQQLTQLLRRSLALAIREQLISPPPRELTQRLPNGRVGLQDPEVFYNSKLARALELNEANSLLSTMETLFPLAGQEGINSPIFDWLDAAKVGPYIARANGVTADIMASPQAIQAKIQARQQAAQAQQAMQAGQTMVDSVQKLGGVQAAKQALSDQLA